MLPEEETDEYENFRVHRQCGTGPTLLLGESRIEKCETE
jgi:hypothetical protein